MMKGQSRTFTVSRRYRRLISKINKQFMKFNIKKTNNSIKKRKKKGQKTLIDISPKKTYRRPRGT